jgi:DNA (cytosine-5)-methyltransferase 1
VAENVAGHVTMGLDQVLTDLEDQGYTTRAIIVPACAKNAPHRRDRVWIIGQYVGYTEHNGSSATKIRGSDIEDAEWPQKRSQQTFQFERASKPRHYETMANTENGRGEQTEWQGGQGFRGRSENIGGSETEREKVDRADVANTKSKGLQGRQFSSTISNKGNEVSNIRTRDSERSTSRSAVKQRVGLLADGISTGLLRHFDREPEHIPRVTKGEKDRAKKLKALGNSIVPQVAAEILLAIRVSEESD